MNCKRGLLHKLTSYGITRRVPSVIRFFLTGKTMKVVVNGMSSEAHGVNAGVLQGSVLGSTLYMLYVNDLSKNTL